MYSTAGAQQQGKKGGGGVEGGRKERGHFMQNPSPGKLKRRKGRQHVQEHGKKKEEGNNGAFQPKPFIDKNQRGDAKLRVGQ